MKNWLAALALAVSALTAAGDVVVPEERAARSATRHAAWVIPLAVVFGVIAIARRKQRNRP